MLDISIVTPVFNEQENLKILYERLVKVLNQQKLSYEIIFVDDGSKDDTLSILKQLHKKDPCVKVISFSRNFGHQIAVSAGLDYSTGKCVITMDSDLQDAPEDIPKFLAQWQKGYDCVYAVRVRRQESWVRSFFFKSFYRIFNQLSEVTLPLDAGDFCLMDRKVVNALKAMPERNRFLRALRCWAGFNHIGIPQERPMRQGGSIEKGMKRLFHIAPIGIFGFSYLPLRLASITGALISFGGFLLILKILYEKFFTSKPILGWTSLMITVIFFSGLIILFLGLIGEYICRIYDETKGRPLYFMKESRGLPDSDKNFPHENNT